MNGRMQRREFLRLSSGTLVASYLAPWVTGAGEKTPEALLARLRHGAGRVVTAGTAEGAGKVALSRQWDGDFCSAKLVNHGKQAVRIHQVVICEATHDLP